MHAKDCGVTIFGGPRVTRWTFYHTPNTCAGQNYICLGTRHACGARVAVSQHEHGYRTKFVAANGISAGDETGQTEMEYVSGNELARAHPARACPGNEIRFKKLKKPSADRTSSVPLLIPGVLLKCFRRGGMQMENCASKSPHSARRRFTKNADKV